MENFGKFIENPEKSKFYGKLSQFKLFFRCEGGGGEREGFWKSF